MDAPRSTPAGASSLISDAVAMVDRRTRATEQILAHVDRARDMIQDFRKDCIGGEGVLKNPQLRAAALRAACDELTNALKLVRHTRWND
jgi:hypothetical protein